MLITLQYVQLLESHSLLIILQDVQLLESYSLLTTLPLDTRLKIDMLRSLKLKGIQDIKGFQNRINGSKMILLGWVDFAYWWSCIGKGLQSTKLPRLVFTELAHWADSVIESRCSSACVDVCMSPPSVIYFQASHWPTGHMTRSQASHW